MSDPLLVFTDESGDTSMSRASLDSSREFCCAAVFVLQSKADHARDTARSVSASFFSGAVLKSSNIGNNHLRRVKVLHALQSSGVQSLVQLVNKTEILKATGLDYKPSFFKYVNGLLYKRMSRFQCDLIVKTDAYGSKQFQESFKAYMEKRIQPNLLTKFEIDPVLDETEPLIQVADIIAGSWRKTVELGSTNSDAKDILHALRPLTAGVDIFPRRLIDREAQLTFEIDEAEQLREVVLRSADHFIAERSEEEDIYAQIQILVLERLIMLEQTASGASSWIYSQNLINLISQGLGVKLGPQTLMTRVIGPLRDSGVIIAGGNQGYKIATDAESLSKYINHTGGVVLPMVSRLRKAREVVRGALAGHDILHDDAHKSLRLIVEALDHIN